MTTATPCIAVLGGSFDPPHNGHLALARHFTDLLHPDALRVVPAGNPWQKQPLQTPAQDRAAMARAAFAGMPIPVIVDEQEIQRPGPSYTVDTLHALRTELGPSASIALLMGADQLQRLHTWHAWRQLFAQAHLCVATRPGFDMRTADDAVAAEFARRTAPPEQLRTTPHGLTLLSHDLAADISATALRAMLRRGERPVSQLPCGVLDYIEQHHLYRD